MRLLTTILLPSLLLAQQQLVWYPAVEGNYDWSVTQYERTEKQINVLIGRVSRGRVKDTRLTAGNRCQRQ